MRLSGNDRAKHDIQSAIGRAGGSAPTSSGFTIKHVGSPSVKTAHPKKSLPFSRVVVRLIGRFGYLVLAEGKRNLWQGMSYGRLVRQRVWYAWAYDGVIAIKSNFPVHAVLKFPWIVLFVTVVIVVVHKKR